MMEGLSTKDLNKLRSQSKIIINRVEIFVETYLSETTTDDSLNNKALDEILQAINVLSTTASKMKTVVNNSR
ncbi:MAG: hypothetical protein PUP91_21870 [Rhizonema sp. PD37]|nr:hypothetical protein [Rhizonema sp. PD37]